ncbi:MAG: DNA (cytosine-5-)-methyltransferase [Prevotella sp.]|nr:DNA (cytosine-5-)-methyltransferase [Prevotellaceae bacterium]MDY5344556.1 DNA (cytosine-5-)-methyltransferase [Prevotella sp.]
MSKRIASLFSGCGGLDIGFTGGFDFGGFHYDKLATKIVFANDVDQDACTCYNSNSLLTNDGSLCTLSDIRDIESCDIPDFDILLAGFPCQPFSNAGKRKGVNDDNGRGTLFAECERIIKDKIELGNKPQAFVFENVRGIMSSKMPDGITCVPDEITNRMKRLGYNVSIKLVCASDYGVPQKRYRVLIVGIDDQLGIGQYDFVSMEKLVVDNNIPSEHFGKAEELLIGRVLQNIDNTMDNDVWSFSPGTQNMVNLIGPCNHGEKALSYFIDGYSINELPKECFEGRSWKDIPYEKLSERFRKIADNPQKYHAPKFFRRFAFGEINGTITASAQPDKCGITHPIENRRYSVRECARIQSFPDSYSFGSIPLQSRYKVIGNAVPPVMAWVLAKTLLNFLPEDN